MVWVPESEPSEEPLTPSYLNIRYTSPQLQPLFSLTIGKSRLKVEQPFPFALTKLYISILLDCF